MMQLRYYIMVNFFLLLSNSCQVIKLFYGISEPKIIHYTELNNYYQKKYKIRDSICYYIPQKVIDSLKEYPYKPGWIKGFRPLQFKVFNNKGQIITQYASCEGNISKLGILNKYPPGISPYVHDTTYDIKMENKIVRSKCEKKQIEVNDAFITFVCYTAKWMGKPSIDLYKSIIQYKEKYKSYNIKIVLVNVGEME